ncbi:MAG: sigma-70 family RNA polymerase sigma factor [Polyangiaceae bacterium]
MTNSASLPSAIVLSSCPGAVDRPSKPTPSREPLRRLIDEHHEFVWRCLRRLGVAEADTDDATQDVFLVLARRLSDVEQGRERAFLFGIVERVASTRRRGRARRREEPLDPTYERPASELGPEELSELSSARPLLDEVLDTLSAPQRTVFVLYELQELSVPEIAELLEVPSGTVSWRLKAAREAFLEAAERLRAREAFRGRRS